MPFAVTHVLAPIIFLELVRDGWKKASKFFSRKHVFLVGVAGLLPDVDLLIYRAIELLGSPAPLTDIGHRIILHNVWIPSGFLLFFFILRSLVGTSRGNRRKGNRKKELMSFSKVFLVLFIGFSMHLLLDAVLTGNVIPFYPLGDYNVNLNFVGQIASATGVPALTILVSMDALLLLFWLWHQETEKHIKDYF